MVDFLWSPFPRKQSTKNHGIFRGKFGAEFGAKFGAKIRKIRALFVLQPFWPKSVFGVAVWPLESAVGS